MTLLQTGSNSNVADPGMDRTIPCGRMKKATGENMETLAANAHYTLQFVA